MIRFDFKGRGCDSASYCSPKEFCIAGISSVIVDPHNETFGPTHNFLIQRGLTGGTKFHVDNHSDMCIPDKPYAISLGVDAVTYGQRFLGIADFNVPLVYSGVFNNVFWYDPRDGSPLSRVAIRAPVVSPEGGYSLHYYKLNDNRKIARVGRPDGRNHNVEMVRSRAEGKPFSIDVDLDAFACVDDSEYKYFLEGGSQELFNSVVSARFYGLFNVLRELPKPDFISIARSQNEFCRGSYVPATYTAPELVDSLEDNLVRSLDIFYSKR